MNLNSFLRSFQKLLKTAEFSKGIKFAAAAVLPVLTAGYFEQLSIGISMAIGVLLASPSDVPGSLGKRVTAVSLSIIFAVVATILAGFAATVSWLFVPVLVVMIFGLSMISVYGFRASLIAFSGLFAIVLSMAKIASEAGVLFHALFVGLGGIWYLILVVLVFLLNRKKQTEMLLAEAFDLTADYLEVRNKLLQHTPTVREEITKELVSLQTAINEKHEIIREMLISRRRKSGRSATSRKRLLIFTELVDILEIGMANPVNVEKMEQLFAKHRDRINIIREWNKRMARQLREFSLALADKKKYKPAEDLEEIKEKAWIAIRLFEEELQQTGDREALVVYRNILNFKEKQHQKLLSMERLLRNRDSAVESDIRRKDVGRFVTTRDYDLKTLQNNLDFQSPIFRHSLRLTVTMMAGFLLGTIFEFQNPYWILLTTLVIMRPGYALTRQRFKQRLYGTLIGGAVAVSIVLLIQNQVVYAVLSVITLVLAFSMIQNNYKAAAAFITLNVVFVYSLLRPDALEVIEFRVLDTIVGAGLAFVANKFLWPTWEYTTIHKFIHESLDANCAYLTETEKLYGKKSRFPTSYKLARKRAFLAVGDLNAAFQRMAQEPVTGKDQLGETFRVVSLNQEFLTATASLGTFIMSYATTESSEFFGTYMRAIRQNLKNSVAVLKGKSTDFEEVSVTAAKEHYALYYKDLVKLRKVERDQGHGEISEGLRERFQEVQLVVDQLQWLEEISDKLKEVLLKSTIKPPL